MFIQIATWVVVVLFFVTAVMAIGSFVTGGETTKMKSRVERLTRLPEEVENELEIKSERKSLLSGIDLRPMLSRVAGDSYFEALEKQLAQADIKLRASEFIIMRVAIFLFGVGVLIIVFRSLLLAILCALPLLLLHKPVLGFLKKRRISKFSNQMAEFLILIVNSLRAGQTFMQGCSVASAESPDPISTEFKQVIKEVNLGMPEDEAMENLLIRVPSEDLKIVVSAYSIQRRVGGNLAEILEKTAATVRERIKIHGQIDTLTTQGKLSGALVGGMPFVIAFAISGINPDYMKPLFTPPWGYALIGVALFMQLLGAIVIKKIVTIEV
jgi:tight adherence protein B